MEKVKLPRAIAEELDHIIKHELYPIPVVIGVFNRSKPLTHVNLDDYFETDRSRRIGIIMQALVNGYEVEESKEDRVRKVVSDFCHGAVVSEWVIEEIKKIYEE